MTQTPTATVRSYDAKDLIVLEGLEAVRKRPGMYIGSTGTRGLMHCLWELMDNAVDEALAGSGSCIEVVLHPDGSAEVRDQGAGIPVDKEPTTGLPGVEVAFTRLHAGGKFGGGSYAATGGLHGVGASVVNALAARVDVEVDRGGSTTSISFRRGVPGVFDGPGPDAGFVRASGVHKGKRVPKGRTGTRVRFWPDRQIFTREAGFVLPEVLDRARQTSYLIPGLQMVVEDRTGVAPLHESFLHAGGISEFVDNLSPDEALVDTIRLQGAGTFTETVPMLDAQDHMVSTEVTRELTVDLALRWGTGYDTTVRSFVNVVATPQGGTHVAGFERGLTRALNAAMRSTKALKVNDADIVKDDAMEGLTAVLTVNLPEPQFEGQTKEVLGTPAASKIVAQVVTSQLTSLLESSKRAEKARARAIMEKVQLAARARMAARAQRDNARKVSSLESSTLPAKLADCRQVGHDRSELFIVEGDSALGTAKSARDSEFQALLPIRGKILNVQRASVSDMLHNAECASIMQVVGAVAGARVDLDAVRYKKIILMADADSDGAHIRCLLLTLFFRYLRPLVDDGRVYCAMAPLHRVELTQVRKGMPKYVYTYSDPELQRTLASLSKRGATWKDPVQRYKGLGEMDADQLAETTMDPRQRTLRRVTARDAEQAAAMFDLLMGNDVGPRRDLIVSSADSVDSDQIDL
jgi:DNA gyrase subunit B